MLVLNLPFKALMFLTLMRPSLVLFLVLWLKLVKDFLDRKSGSAGMPRPISYAVFCSKKKTTCILMEVGPRVTRAAPLKLQNRRGLMLHPLSLTMPPPTIPQPAEQTIKAPHPAKQGSTR